MNADGSDARLIDGRFELLQRLGGGGMGLVWRARDNALHREVALKEVRPPDPAMAAANPEDALELRERVLREARSLARLQHPNVVIIHHIVDTADHPHPWLVMELVTGGSLADRLSRGPLTVPEAARIGRGVLSALRAAHAAGIQHRDVKPGNVLLRPDGTPVLTDFGIAAMQGATALTSTGALIGSPEYIAPERIRGAEGNPSSDLWSLGMMLYVAVEGHHPLRRATTLATLAAVLDEPLPPPARAGQLAPVLAAVLARDPAVRPNAEQLDQALAAAEAGAAPGPAGGPVAWSPTGLDLPRPAATPWPGADPAMNAWTGSAPGSAPGTGGGPGGPGYDSGSGAGPGYGHGYGYGAAPADTFGHPGEAGPGRPGFPGHPVDAVPADAVPTGATTHGPAAPVPRGGRARAVTLSVVAVALAGALTWTLLPDSGAENDAGAAPGPSVSGPAATGSTGPTTPAAASTAPEPAAAPSVTAKTAPPSAVPPDFLTPAGVRTTVEAFRPSLADSKITQLTVYPTYASAEGPTAADPTVFDRLNYRDGKVTRTPGGTMTSRQKTVDLRSYDWDIIPALLQKAQDTLNVPNPTSRYLIIGPDSSDGTPSIKVYLSGEYGGGYLSADTKGTVKRSFPRGS
ncbi:protein kinase [Kitasatospora sp. NBC_01246]|uniref:protein kinase domain-containing protein n=1 Tax=Kitasatospora sp. NBC_01246 TaxID=2903570 RepID=UPI002E33E468|nr:protein kinase [Kitasatospora sp. NBC_01246]